MAGAVTATGLFRTVRDALVFRVLPGRGSGRVVERFVGMRSCLSALACRRRQDRAETGRRSWGAGVVDPAVLRISVGSERNKQVEEISWGVVSSRQGPSACEGSGMRSGRRIRSHVLASENRRRK